MDARRWVLHVDLDQFLAAVEVLRHPELRGRPVVVGGTGDPTRRRMVVSTASYEARAFGVHSGMPLRQAARRCPDCVFLPLDAPTYLAASERVMATLRAFPVVVEVVGWDEAFLGADTADPERLALEIQAAVLAETELHCSVGIGRNKLQAKLATGFAKPAGAEPQATNGVELATPAGAEPQAANGAELATPARPELQAANGTEFATRAGVYRLTDANWLAVMGARPTEALWGIGTRTAQRLEALGIHTVAQLAEADVSELAAAFGPTIGPSLRLMGMGLGPTDVSAEPWVPRSRSRETTFPTDLTDRAEIEAQVRRFARELAREAADSDRRVLRVGIKIRFAPFFTRSSAMKLPSPTVDEDAIERAALAVLGRFDLSRPVRLLGVRVEYVPVR